MGLESNLGPRAYWNMVLSLLGFWLRLLLWVMVILGITKIGLSESMDALPFADERLLANVPVAQVSPLATSGSFAQVLTGVVLNIDNPDAIPLGQ